MSKRIQREVVYLASPYTHKDFGVRHMREKKASIAAGMLVEKGYSVIAPITQSHRIAEMHPEIGALDHDVWMEVDVALVKRVDRVVVLTLNGWKESKGVAEEMQCAKDNNIPISFMTEEGELNV